MGSPYIGEIRMFGGTFAPLNWHFCDGTLLDISQNAALYQLIGTTYGGNGTTNFALPNLLGRSPIHQGTYQGTPFVLGQLAGTETVSLLASQMPSHTHLMMSASATSVQSPANAYPGVSQGTGLSEAYVYEAATTPATGLAPNSIAPNLGGQPHDNMQPFLCVTFIISLEGIFPTQS
jgi:microcystin-dependent protein